MNEIAAWVGTAAAVAAAVIVSWQSYETRRSANASNSAVEAAVEGLRLSHQQVNEAIRARIDVAMPTITVVASPPEWPPLEPSAFGGEAQPLQQGPDSPTLYMPRDADRRIAVRLRVMIRNDSAQHVLITANGFMSTNDMPSYRERFEIAPGETLFGTTEANRTLKEWVEIYKSRSTGDSGPEHRATIAYLGQGDTSANDTWTITLGGTAVEPVAEFEGGWRIIAQPNTPNGTPASMDSAVAPRARTYYLSKLRNEKLLDV